ncbi:hypothetical protein ES705_20999 [subsurface metagenome]
MKKCEECGKEIKDRSSNNLKYCLVCSRRMNYKKYSRRIIQQHAKHHKKVFLKVLTIYKSRCAVCGWQLKKGFINGKNQWARGNEIHHIKPLYKGGKETIDNLILLCPNHHKEADLGILTAEDLRKHQKLEKPEITNKEIEKFFSNFDYSFSIEE